MFEISNNKLTLLQSFLLMIAVLFTLNHIEFENKFVVAGQKTDNNSNKDDPPPGLSLQQALDQLQAEINTLKLNVTETTENEVGKISQLETDVADVKTNLATISKQLAKLEEEHAAVAQEAGEGDVEEDGGGDNGGGEPEPDRYAEIETQIGEVQGLISGIQVSNDEKFARLDRINEIWKKNFKVINSTIIKLKQPRRVRFRVLG